MAVVYDVLYGIFEFLAPGNVRLATKIAILHGLEVEICGYRHLLGGLIENPRWPLLSIFLTAYLNSLCLKVYS